MKDYQIIADTGCDISPEILKRWGVDFCQLTFKFDGEDKEYQKEYIKELIESYGKPKQSFFSRLFKRKSKITETASEENSSSEENNFSEQPNS